MRRSVVFLALCGCGQEYGVLQGPVQVDPEDVTECGFTPIEDTRFQRYDCNPVFTNSGEDWVEGGVGSIGFHAEQVLGHTFYQMWYSTGYEDGNYGLGYAISPDGTNWEPLGDNPVVVNPDSGWNRDTMGAVTVVWDDSEKEYVLAYQGINYTTNANGLGLMTSPDGQDWEPFNDGEPMIELSKLIDGTRYCWPLSLTWDAEDGFLGYISGGKATNSVCQVYSYQGDELGSIEPNDEPVLRAGPDEYDIEGQASASVVKLDGTYYMFYTGIPEWRPVPEDPDFIYPYNTSLNVATSDDGIHWEKDEDNPIREISLVDEPMMIGSVSAQVVGPRIHLWIDDYYEDLETTAVGYFLYEPNIEPH
jgi:hypothetical protein